MSNRYPKRKLQRLAEYDYSQAGAYFVTICAYKKNCIFGQVSGDRVNLTQLGELVSENWRRLPQIYEFISLDTFVIMPNHFHAIVWLNETSSGKSLSKIIAYFKALSAHEARNCVGKPLLLWQRGFFEHIVRNDRDLYRIRQYIVDNPAQWSVDQENPNCLRTDCDPRVNTQNTG
jgi:REP element-mobilizing transposase RayT